MEEGLDDAGAQLSMRKETARIRCGLGFVVSKGPIFLSRKCPRLGNGQSASPVWAVYGQMKGAYQKDQKRRDEVTEVIHTHVYTSKHNQSQSPNQPWQCSNEVVDASTHTPAWASEALTTPLRPYTNVTYVSTFDSRTMGRLAEMQRKLLEVCGSSLVRQPFPTR